MTNYKDLCKALESLEIDSSRIQNPNLARIVGRVIIEKDEQYIFGRWFHKEHTDVPWDEEKQGPKWNGPYHTESYRIKRRSFDQEIVMKYSESAYHTESNNKPKKVYLDSPEEREHIAYAESDSHNQLWVAWLKKHGKTFRSLYDRHYSEYSAAAHFEYDDIGPAGRARR